MANTKVPWAYCALHIGEILPLGNPIVVGCLVVKSPFEVGDSC